MKCRLRAILATILATSAIMTPTVGEAAGRRDIIETVTKAGQFKTLLEAAKAADLIDVLRGPGPYTVFAPTDAAFAKLASGKLGQLMGNPAKLRVLLLHHVVPSRKTLAGLIKMHTDTTGAGSTLSYRAVGKQLMVDSAKVVMDDLKASNGNILAIDSVLTVK